MNVSVEVGVGEILCELLEVVRFLEVVVSIEVGEVLCVLLEVLLGEVLCELLEVVRFEVSLLLS